MFIIISFIGLAICEVVLSPVVLTLSVAIHEKVAGIFADSARLTELPLQTIMLFALVIVGAGRTSTVIVCGLPVQFPDVEVGVTVYVTVCTTVVVLLIVLLKVLLVWLVVLSPVVFGLLVAFQTYVEGTLLVNGIFTAVPLQIVALFALVITTPGFTVIVTVIGVPTQYVGAGPVGVIV